MRVRFLSVIAVPALLVLIAVLASPARAGGWASVELSSTPDGVRAGQAWVVDLRILQHGRTPLDGVQPAITVAERRGSHSQRYAAHPTESPGVYRARVTFPTAGRWEYRVDDGFGGVETYPVVTIAEPVAPPAAANEGSGAAATGAQSWWSVIVVVAIGLGLAAVVMRRSGFSARTASEPDPILQDRAEVRDIRPAGP